MALESVFAIAPPLVGELNKDTKNGDFQRFKSENFDDDIEEGEAEDLEEGEILDSAGEGDDQTCISLNQVATGGLNTRTLLGDGSPSQVKKTDHVKDIKEILALVTHVDALHAVIGGPQSAKRKAFDVELDSKNGCDESQTQGAKKKQRYVDHDFALDDEEWSTPNAGFKVNKSKDTHFDYSRELAAYRGSPFCSSDSNPPNDEPFCGDSPNRRSRSPGNEEDGDKKVRKQKIFKGITKSRKSNGKIGKKRRILDSKAIRRRKEHRIKTICKFFLEGKCSKGIDCPFLHSGSPEKKKELCKFYLNGYCAKGKACLFMHDDFPCKFFHTGAKCYADEKCRFSHKPLSDEGRKLLDRYLQASHGGGDESDYHERTRREPKEPKAKRPCLLGSPPRHIKEAAETKRWQEEMIKLQQKGKGRSAFEIQVSPTREIISPSKFSRPNFYTDTLPESPNKRPLTDRPPEPRVSPQSHNISNDCPPHVYSKNENDGQDWKNICDLVHKRFSSPPKSEEIPADVEQDCVEQKPSEETAEISEVDETPEDFGEILSPRMAYEDLTVNSELNDGFSDSEKKSPKDKDTPLTAMSPPPVLLAEPAPPPINIPSCLPRKQRELYLRIHQQQKEQVVVGRDPENCNSVSESEDKPAVEPEKSVTDNDDNNGVDDDNETWYSSEDDDNGDNDQLANVLKKLHTAPSSNLGTASKSSMNVVQMIMSTAIRQKGNQKIQSCALSEPNEFWQNILSSAGSSSTITTTSSTTCTNQPLLESGGASTIQTQGLSNVIISNDSKSSTNDAKPSFPRDPRLLNRDLRKMGNVSKEISILSPGIIEEKMPPLFPSIDSGPSGLMSNRLKDINSMLQNQTPAVVVEGLKGMSNVPYKLHEVKASPPNYLSYIVASQSDPKLLCDPRLRKHIAQGIQQIQPLFQQGKTNVLSNIPPVYPIGTQNIHVGLSHPVPEKMASLGVKEMINTEEQSISEPKQTLGRIADPRIRRVDNLSDPRRAHVNNTNHVSAENTWIPPAPSIVPPPASHLPRAIADPRLAKLHRLQRPLDPRRAMNVSEKFGPEQKTAVNQEKRKFNLPFRKLRTPPVGVKNTRSKTDSQKQIIQPPDVTSSNSSSAQKMTEKEIAPKTTDISISRKTSMTYTSPLNSYEDCITDSKSSYNSYNRRPQKRIPNSIPASEPSVPIISTAPLKEITEPTKASPDFSICIPSVTESQCMENNASLKDMFKTIDPTASPFC